MLLQFLVPVIVVTELVHLAFLLLRLLIPRFGLITVAVAIAVLIVMMVVVLEESLHESFFVLGLCLWTNELENRINCYRFDLP